MSVGVGEWERGRGVECMWWEVVMREGGGGEWEVVTSDGGGGEWEGGRVGAESVGGGGAFVSKQSSLCVTRTCRVTYSTVVVLL